MITPQTVKYSLRNLKQQKGRSFLTILSIFIGISTIFIFISFGLGLYSYIEELTEVFISIYGYTIAILGSIDQSEIARKAIGMLIKGSQHSTVYNYLQKKRHELKKKNLQLWEDGSLFPI